MVKTSVIVIGSVVVLGVAGTLSAQNNGNPSILAAVQALQSTVNSLVTTISGINTTVNTIAASTGEGNVLFTPSVVAFPPDTLICNATNVSGATRNVTLQLLNGNGGAVLASASGDVASASTIRAEFVPGAAGVRAICKIAVNNGVKSDVRGAVATYAAANASDKGIVAAF
jgi:hypothetical protein